MNPRRSKWLARVVLGLLTLGALIGMNQIPVDGGVPVFPDTLLGVCLIWVSMMVAGAMIVWLFMKAFPDD